MSALNMTDFAGRDYRTDTLDECYMVADEMWREGGGADGMLCIGCLEGLKRKLPPEVSPQRHGNATRRRSAAGAAGDSVYRGDAPPSETHHAADANGL
jgi:hypothetical protein